MVCNFCGKENADDAVFCKACGNRLVSEEAPEELYTENISEEEYAESEEYASYAADSTENNVIVCANCGAANPAGDAFAESAESPLSASAPSAALSLPTDSASAAPAARRRTKKLRHSRRSGGKVCRLC